MQMMCMSHNMHENIIINNIGRVWCHAFVTSFVTSQRHCWHQIGCLADRIHYKSTQVRKSSARCMRTNSLGFAEYIASNTSTICIRKSIWPAKNWVMTCQHIVLYTDVDAQCDKLVKFFSWMSTMQILSTYCATTMVPVYHTEQPSLSN